MSAPSPLLLLEAGLLAVSGALLLLSAAWSGRTVARLRRERAQRAEALAREERRVAELEQEAACSWAGYRKFQVVRRVEEGSLGEAASLELSPFRAPGEQGAVRLPRFVPGQYVQLRVDVPGQPSLLTRCYSLSAPWTADRYRITVGRARGGVDPLTGARWPAGVVSSFLLDRVRERAVLDVTVPQGELRVDPARNEPAVLVGWGHHAVPLLCAFDAIAREGTREAWLFLEAPERAALPHATLAPLLERARAAGRRLRVWISLAGVDGQAQGTRPDEDPTLVRRPVVEREGRQAIAWIKRVVPTHFRSAAEFFVSGPALMLGEAKHDLEAWGVAEERVFFEVFDRESLDAISPSEADAGQCQVAFEGSGKSAAWDPEARNLLALAAAHKVRIPSTCKIGKCGECEVPLVTGKVRYAKAPDWKVKPGHCLPCVAAPASPSLVLGA